jgi:hypothetical protein
MKLSFTWPEIENWRDRAHRRLPHLALKTDSQALKFIDKVGFCFAFKAEHSELPCLWHAVCGRRDPIMPIHTHSDPSLSFVWELKNVLPAERKIYYGKVLRRRPTMISLEFLPYFFALLHRTGLKGEYLDEFARGRLSPTAREIMDALGDSSPQVTKGLRIAIGRHAKSKTTEFDKAITELQMKMLIVKISEQVEPFSYEWAPAYAMFPAEMRKARRISIETARERILAKYFEVQLVSSVDAIFRLFGWKKQIIFRTLGQLTEKGVITSNVKVDKKDSKYYRYIK